MSLENAEQNLKEFGKELNLEGLEFDQNHTCILGIDNTFSLHLTYEPNSDRLYLYSPVLDGLPKDPKIQLKLYSAYLEGAILGGQVCAGGIGIAFPEELVLIHTVIEMGPGTDTKALCRVAPVFVNCVEDWRKKSQAICDGQEVPPSAPPRIAGGPGGVPGGQVGPGPRSPESGPPPSGDRFIKI